MQVLVCDDDASVRFIVRRLLEEKWGCVVRECGDGVEALELLSREKFAFMILDIEMPTMNGIETLEEIRACESTRELPVIILSHHRDETGVVRLMQLGISDYLVKPPRGHAVLAKVEKILRSLPAGATASGSVSNVQLSPDTPVLLVDGNPDFRFFFGSVAQRYGPIIQADSGAAALAAFRHTPVRLMFLGGNLGVVEAERVVQKCRELRPDGVRIVRIVDRREDIEAAAGQYDGVIVRSYVPDTFRAALRPYVFVPGAYTALTAVVPELREIIASAATQVFGTMFDSEIAVSQDDAPLVPDYSSVLEIVIDDRFVIDLGIHLPKPAALTATSRLVGVPTTELGDEDCLSVAGELGNMVTGRVHARFRERSMKSVCGLPRMDAGGSFAPPGDADGLLQRFSLREASDFFVSLRVQDRLAEARHAASEAPAAAATKAESAATPSGEDASGGDTAPAI